MTCICRRYAVDLVEIDTDTDKVSVSRIKGEQGIWVMTRGIWSSFLRRKLTYDSFSRYKSEQKLRWRWAEAHERRDLKLLGSTGEANHSVSLLELGSACLAVRELTQDETLVKALASLGPVQIPGRLATAESRHHIRLLGNPIAPKLP